MMNMNNPGASHGAQKHIHGITCDVTECHYNSTNSSCTAAQIKVGPQCADCCNSEDTLCATFKPR